MKRISIAVSICVLLIMAGTAQASSYLTTVVSESGFNHNDTYGDPSDIIGAPTDQVWDSWANAYIKVSMVYAAWGQDAITTFNSGQTAVLSFDHDVINNEGPDFIVFGNSFFVGDGWVTNSTDMDTYELTTGSFTESVTVHVSPDNQTWYTFSSGPYGDDLYPTQGYEWDSVNNTWGDALDYTKPVPSNLSPSDFEYLTVAEAIELYDGSAGGTAFDLDDLPNAPSSIRYVKFTGSGGEIDAVSDID